MLGRNGLSTPSSCRLWFSSLSLPEMCKWFAAVLMLSRLAWSDMSFAAIRLLGGDFDMTGAGE
jgi:hypothetical protein